MIFKVLGLPIPEQAKIPSHKEELIATSERHSYKAGTIIFKKKREICQGHSAARIGVGEIDIGRNSYS